MNDTNRKRLSVLDIYEIWTYTHLDNEPTAVIYWDRQSGQYARTNSEGFTIKITHWSVDL